MLNTKAATNFWKASAHALRTAGAAAGLFALTVLGGCGTTTHASRPPRPPEHAPEDDRRAIYESYRLEQQGDRVVGYAWKRSDGEYSAAELAPVFEQFPETSAKLEEGQLQAIVTLSAAAIGGALLGIALGDTVAGGNMDSGVRTSLYVSGGIVVATGLTITLVWQPGSDLDVVYNRALARSLRVSP